MEERSTATLEKIQQAALAEFLDKGFLGASLRQIVKNAGVTTGAFYGYFSSKEALFNAIVEPHAAALMGRFMEAQTTFCLLYTSGKSQRQRGGHPGQAGLGAQRLDPPVSYTHLDVYKRQGQGLHLLRLLEVLWRSPGGPPAL